MGGAVAAALHQAGHQVIWASAERSEQTRQRASAAELEDVGSLAELAQRSEILLAICPPHASLELAVALSGFGGIYIDANATSPATAEQIASGSRRPRRHLRRWLDHRPAAAERRLDPPLPVRCRGRSARRRAEHAAARSDRIAGRGDFRLGDQDGARGLDKG